MRYDGMVYRPPSEAYSLIVQLTVGCSQNGCAFCDMYKDKKFYIRPLDDVLDDFREARSAYSRIGRIFLADGDALICRADYLHAVLDFIRTYIPECERVTSYASPRSLLTKTADELASLHSAGLDMLYLGLESGCDDVLSYMNKGATSEEIVRACVMGRDAGFKMSVTVISGLGGVEMWERHAVDTARAVTAMKPDYLGALTLSVRPGTELERKERSGEFKTLSPEAALAELKLMIDGIDAEGCVFRSNHVSNYVAVGGTFNRDKAAMIAQIDRALREGGYVARRLSTM